MQCGNDGVNIRLDVVQGNVLDAPADAFILCASETRLNETSLAQLNPSDRVALQSALTSLQVGAVSVLQVAGTPTRNMIVLRAPPDDGPAQHDALRTGIAAAARAAEERSCQTIVLAAWSVATAKEATRALIDWLRSVPALGRTLHIRLVAPAAAMCQVYADAVAAACARQTVVVLGTSAAAVLKACCALRTRLQGLTKREHVPALWYMCESDRVTQLQLQFGVLAAAQGDGAGVTLQGPESAVKRAKEYIEEDAREWRGRAQRYPEEWGELPDGSLLDVPAGSAEETEAHQLLKLGVPGATEIRVQRVVNRRVWRGVREEELKLAEAHRSLQVHKRKLFHGSKGTLPSRIYSDAVGFDHRYSNFNNWYGPGVYFAASAQYSNNGYAHTLPGGLRQLFLAEVLLGRTQQNPQGGSSLRCPADGFDSVEGNGIFVVYNLFRAYPTYLLTYKP